jgi:hypothetical protein
MAGFNIAGNMLATNWGQQAGQNIRQARQEARELEQQNMLAQALPMAISGDQNALAQVYAVNPTVGYRIQSDMQEQKALSAKAKREQVESQRGHFLDAAVGALASVSQMPEAQREAAWRAQEDDLMRRFPDFVDQEPDTWETARTVAPRLAAADKKYGDILGRYGLLPQEPPTQRPYWLGPNGVDEDLYGRAVGLATAGAQLRADNMPPVSVSPNSTLVDPKTGTPVFTAPPPPPKPLPPSISKAESEDIDAIQSATALNADLDAIGGQISGGTLDLGPLDNVISAGRNVAGMSNENSRNYASFKSTLERLRNESLRLNKGVQTEGDAVRAWNELMANLNDPKLVAERLAEIKVQNERAVQFRDQTIQNRRQTYNQEPLDTSQFQTKQPSIGAQPAQSPSASGVPEGWKVKRKP